MMSLAVILLATPLIAAATTDRNNSCAYWQPRGEHGAKGWSVPDAPVRISPWIDSTNMPKEEHRFPPDYEMGITVKPTLHVEFTDFHYDRATELKRIRKSLAEDWDVEDAYQTDFNDTIVISYRPDEPFGVWGGSTSGWYEWTPRKHCWMGVLRFCGVDDEGDLYHRKNITVCGYEVDEWNHDINERSKYDSDDMNEPVYHMVGNDNEYNTDEYLMEEPQEHYEDAVKHASWYRLAKSQGQGVAEDEDDDDDDDDDDQDSEGARSVASIGLSLGLVSLWMLMM